MKYISKSILIIILILITFSLSYSKNVQIIVKGHVTDEYTGKPAGVSMEFTSHEGKKIIIKSNSIDGTYEQVFNSGETWDLTFTNWDIIKQSQSIKIPEAEKYTETVMNFMVKKLSTGLLAFKINLFSPNSDNLTTEGKTFLDNLKNMLVFNRNVTFELSVNSHDTYFKQIKKETIQPVKKNKKKKDAAPEIKTTVIEPDQNLINELVNKRFKALGSYILGFGKFKERIVVSSDNSSGKLLENTDIKSEEPSLIVSVKDIKKIFD